jgi:DNA mismatch repair protein MutS2
MDDSDSKDFQAGELVKLLSLGKTGSVVSGPDRKNRYLVRFGAAEIQCHSQDLKKTAAKRKGSAKNSPKRALSASSGSGGSLKIDLHGLTKAEALERLETALDRALLKNCDQLEIVHGLGSGAIKGVVEAFCSKSKNIAQHSLSIQNPGLTTAWLK